MGGQEGAASRTHSASYSSSSVRYSLAPSWPRHAPPRALALCWLKTVRVKAELRTSSVSKGPGLDEATASHFSQRQPGAGLGLHLSRWERWAVLELNWLELLRPQTTPGYW